MFNPLDIAIYVAVLFGYLWILYVTERSAGRYVRGETAARPETRVHVVSSGSPVAEPQTLPQREVRPRVAPGIRPAA